MIGTLRAMLRAPVLTKCCVHAIAVLCIGTGLCLGQASRLGDAIRPDDTDATKGTCPGAGDCCAVNGSVGCDDVSCCTTVCMADPFCCEMNWDGLCVSEAGDLCGPLCPVLCAPDCGKMDIECVNPGPRYDNRTFVGRLLSNGSAFCTAWIVASDGVESVVMTNSHCVGGDVTNFQVQFNRECDACGGGSFKTTSEYNVTGLITQVPSLDYALLTVAGDPAAVWGQARLDPRVQVVGLPIYEIHHGGTLAKGYDEGNVTAVGVNACVSNENSVDVIASGGASGSPVFRQDNDCATAICNCGPDCQPGFVVPMSNIVPNATPSLTAAGFSFDLCETECNISSAAQPVMISNVAGSVHPLTTNRMLIVKAGDPGRLQALRVTLSSLWFPYVEWEGAELWVGPPALVSENGSSVEPLPNFPNFNAAVLQCDIYCTDWSTFDEIHIFHEGIIPGSAYDVQLVDCSCNLTEESSYSPPLSLTTSDFGDIVEDLSIDPPGPPDGEENIVDALSVVLAFQSSPGAPRKARADIESNCLDLKINITDVVHALLGFSGVSYQFLPKADDPCDSPCTNPLP